MATSGSTKDRTVLDRLRESGITEARALHHLGDGWVRLDGQVVTDPAQPAELPAQVELRILRQFDQNGDDK